MCLCCFIFHLLSDACGFAAVILSTCVVFASRVENGLLLQQVNTKTNTAVEGFSADFSSVIFVSVCGLG